MSFSIRTLSGVAEAVGTYYAVTEYNGQSYTSVKKGDQEKDHPPNQAGLFRLFDQEETRFHPPKIICLP